MNNNDFYNEVKKIIYTIHKAITGKHFESKRYVDNKEFVINDFSNTRFVEDNISFGMMSINYYYQILIDLDKLGYSRSSAESDYSTFYKVLDDGSTYKITLNFTWDSDESRLDPIFGYFYFSIYNANIFISHDKTNCVKLKQCN